MARCASVPGLWCRDSSFVVSDALVLVAVTMPLKWELPQDWANETEFKKSVVTLFRQRGWRVQHGAARPARQGRYVTSGSPGFPDLVLLKPPDLFFLELKHVGASKARKDAEAQRVWINGIQACGLHAYVVDGGSWPLLVAVARDGLQAITNNEGGEHVESAK